MAFEEKNLVCKDCGEEFVFTVGEQEFFAEKGFENLPSRCPECRRARRQNSNFRGGSRDRQMYEVICDECGVTTNVPFKPNGSKPIYCKDCYQSKRSDSWA